jgi:hypothetical protein
VAEVRGLWVFVASIADVPCIRASTGSIMLTVVLVSLAVRSPLLRKMLRDHREDQERNEGARL